MSTLGDFKELEKSQGLDTVETPYWGSEVMDSVSNGVDNVLDFLNKGAGIYGKVMTAKTAQGQAQDNAIKNHEDDMQQAGNNSMSLQNKNILLYGTIAVVAIFILKA